jgi:signal transduction histidine kinase
MVHPNDNEDNFVEIQVIDNGVGMNKKEKNNLFKLFGTMKNTRESNT